MTNIHIDLTKIYAKEHNNLVIKAAQKALADYKKEYNIT